MSMYSGKCDLFDVMSMYGADELEAFHKFKELTNGILYQRRKVTVTKTNRDWVKAHTKQFDWANGIYHYWGVEYKGLRALNKAGVCVDVPLTYTTLLDLIPYYPYIVVEQYTDNKQLCIFLSRKSYVETLISDEINNSGLKEPNLWVADFYKSKLQAHYAEVCQNYIFKNLSTRTHWLLIEADMRLKRVDEGYLVETAFEVDDQLPCEYVFDDGQPHKMWAAPKRYDSCHILLAKEDVEEDGLALHSNASVKIKYYEPLKEVAHD